MLVACCCESPAFMAYGHGIIRSLPASMVLGRHAINLGIHSFSGKRFFSWAWAYNYQFILQLPHSAGDELIVCSWVFLLFIVLSFWLGQSILIWTCKSALVDVCNACSYHVMTSTIYILCWLRASQCQRVNMLASSYVSQFMQNFTRFHKSLQRSQTTHSWWSWSGFKFVDDIRE
jgi:hypothetical protein